MKSRRQVVSQCHEDLLQHQDYTTHHYHDSQQLLCFPGSSLACLCLEQSCSQVDLPPLRLVLCTRNGQNGVQTDFLSPAWFSKKSITSSFAFLPSLSFHYLILLISRKTYVMALFLLHYFGVFLGLMATIFQLSLACHLNPALQRVSYSISAGHQFVLLFPHTLQIPSKVYH